MDGWSNELPRVPGYYWVVVPPDHMDPSIEQVFEIGGRLMVQEMMSREFTLLEEGWPPAGGALWWGPLMPPEAPER